MVKRSRTKHKGRSERGSFAALPHACLDHPKFAALSPHAVKLLVDLFAQYRGANNGDLAMAWKLMRKKGWRSKHTLYKALNELLEGGWIIKTRQGGKHCCNLFAVTWLGIDECNGKLDVHPNPRPLGWWKDPPKEMPTKHETSELREYRKLLGLTQKELAQRLGMKQSKISKIERGVLPIPKFIEKTIARQRKKDIPNTDLDSGSGNIGEFDTTEEEVCEGW